MQRSRTGTAARVLLVVAFVALTGGATALAAPASPARIRGHEVFRIASLSPTVRHQRITAKGAFNDKGHYVADGRTSTAAFAHGRVVIAHSVGSTTYTGPNLKTCTFGIRQTGTFRIVKATGRYRGIRESGDYRTTISGTLRHVSGGCGSQIIAYHQVTYESGYIS